MGIARKDTKIESEGAEHLVLGHLLLLGIPAYKTYANMPGYDIIATWPATHKSARVQVKSRWSTSASGFFIRNFNTDFVVAAMLNRGTATNPELIRPPEFFVFPIRIIKKYYRDEKLPKFMLTDVPRLDIYRDAWNRIAVFLGANPQH